MNDEPPLGDAPDRRDEMLSEYLFGDLEPAAHAQIERLLARDGDLRARAERLAPLVGQLSDLPDAIWAFVASEHAGEHPSPDHLTTVGALTAAPAPEGDRPPHPPGSRPRWWRRPLALRPALAATAAAALLAIGVSLGALLERVSSPSGNPVALRALPGEPSNVSGRALITEQGRIVLTVHHLPVPHTGTYYEAWLMTSATRLLPIATFRPDATGRARIDIPLPAPAAGYRYIDISLQQTNAGLAHSRVSVLRGNI